MGVDSLADRRILRLLLVALVEHPVDHAAVTRPGRPGPRPARSLSYRGVLGNSRSKRCVCCSRLIDSQADACDMAHHADGRQRGAGRQILSTPSPARRNAQVSTRARCRAYRSRAMSTGLLCFCAIATGRVFRKMLFAPLAPKSPNRMWVYFESRSGFIASRSTGTDTCSWLMSHRPLTFL